MSERLDPDVVLNHELVPKHEVIEDEEEIERILEELGVSKDDLPRIHTNDPVIVALSEKLGRKIRPGALVRIERESPTAGKVVVYRVVTSPPE
ncbi:DNA-directed RNA polymerase subunit H [Methanopyrus sp.]|jgi:DNA-directed RNA polymerase subunit H